MFFLSFWVPGILLSTAHLSWLALRHSKNTRRKGWDWRPLALLVGTLLLWTFIALLVSKVLNASL